MNGYEKEINSREEQKNRIRERYKGVDRSELEFIPAKPKEKLFEDTTEKRVCAMETGWNLCRRRNFRNLPTAQG